MVRMPRQGDESGTERRRGPHVYVLRVCAASSLIYAFRGIRALYGRPCVVPPLTVDASCAPVLRASLALQGELNVES